MKILILSGGTGSIALQRGLYRALEARLDCIDTRILVNAYDNGLSTGDVRRVMGRRILGPSDVRKNQETRLRLLDPNSPWLRLLGVRFTVAEVQAEHFCTTSVSTVVSNLERKGDAAAAAGVLYGAIEEYFRSDTALQVTYSDFALANVIYAGLAKANDNSLRSAARIMAGLLGIPDNVLLNDDRSLFLGAVTSSGKRIADEGGIVCWGSETDPFVDVFFTDEEGKEDAPELCLEAWTAIIGADLIILSSGTQWSSLIPTYASRGFRCAVNQSKADVLMIMNRIPDRDSPGQSASDLIDILVPRYFDVGRLHVLADLNGHSRMQDLSPGARQKVATFTRACLSGPRDPLDKHDPQRLAEVVGKVVFREYLDSDLYLFDYDDTLVGRDKKFPRSSEFNVESLGSLNRLTQVAICSGNTSRAIGLGAATPTKYGGVVGCKPLRVFADGGINEYSYYMTTAEEHECAGTHFVRCIRDESLLCGTGIQSAQGIVNTLVRVGVPSNKIDVRGDAVVAIRPVERAERDALMRMLGYLLQGSGLEIRERGRTTVEICKSGLSKSYAVEYLSENGAVAPKITYVGDELDSGNDWDIKELATRGAQVKCLRVDGPGKTAFFMVTLMAHLNKNVGS